MGEALTFRGLRAANVRRCKRWHPRFLSGDDEWTGSDWSNAMCGEAGETANVVKKLRRVETGTAPGQDDPPKHELLSMLADELADTVTYADLLAAHYGIDLAAAVAIKFNRVSQRQGFPDRLPEDGLDEALGADVVLPVTAETVYALRQEIVRLEARLAAAEAEVKAARAVMAPTVERWQYLHSRFPDDVAGSWPEMVAYLAARDAHDALSAPPTDRGADG